MSQQPVFLSEKAAKLLDRLKQKSCGMVREDWLKVASIAEAKELTDAKLVRHDPASHGQPAKLKATNLAWEVEIQVRRPAEAVAEMVPA